MTEKEKVQIIEQTSKKWKGMMLAGMLTTFVSCVAITGGIAADSDPSGLWAALFMGGILTWVVGRFGKFWHHE
jgi:hypothetical protein